MELRTRSPLADVAQAAAVDRAVDPLTGARGARVGLLWNQHASSVAFWPVLEQTVEETLAPRQVEQLYKSSTWNAAEPAEVDRLTEEVDLVLVGVGGCGSCTTATVRDGVNVLKRGTPAVVLVHEPFERLAHLQFEIQGVLDIPGVTEVPILVYERDLSDLDDDVSMRSKADQVLARAIAIIEAQGRDH